MTFGYKEKRVALVPPVLRRRVMQLEADINDQDYDSAYAWAKELEVSVKQAIEYLDELRNDPEYMNHPNLLKMVRGALREKLQPGESLLEQGLIKEPWQVKAGMSYISTDDRVQGRKRHDQGGLHQGQGDR